ncbi:DUF2142 domain-containing protein [Candidatus Frankia alpina]|uniref:DUF2142 domain-containing protein n=1 Tax=Candidatus Frankia alpina TaxID=2699483 RepID=UPI001F1F33FD|nr:DUF2142 domain-containing protein [Candidatus Frankia alpina]
MHGRGRLARLLLVAGFGLLLAAWVGSNAPGFGPDEPANFVKEVGAGTGQWSGTPGRLAHPAFGAQPGAPERIDWINRNSRVFRLPAGLDPGPAGFPCNLFRNWLSVSCLDRPHPRPPATRALSYVGTYEPYVYAGRAVTAALVAGLLAVAIAAAWNGPAGPLSVAGVLLAASPMVLFMGSVLGTNGIEIAAATALFTLVLRMGREAGPPRWAWPAVGVVGALLALARPTGPAWVLLAPLVGLVLAQRRTRGGGSPPAVAGEAVRAGVRRHPRHEPSRRDAPGASQGTTRWRGANRWRQAWPVLWLGLAAGGVAATALWERAVQPHPGIRRALVVEGLHRLPHDADAWVRQWVGVFGWASLPMPTYAYRIWWLAVVALALVALAADPWRARLGFVAVLVGAAVVAVGLDVVVLRQTRFPVYGRYLLPLAVLLPLAAGEIVTRRAARLPAAVRRPLQVAVPLLVAAVHLVGLWANARRYAVGAGGPGWFLGRSQWNPPGGWSPWFALAVAGAACLVGFALTGLRAAPATPGPRTVDGTADGTADGDLTAAVEVCDGHIKSGRGPAAWCGRC